MQQAAEQGDKRGPLGRRQRQAPGRPSDIAGTAQFLASHGARHITGQTIHVNGGAFTTR